MRTVGERQLQETVSCVWCVAPARGTDSDLAEGPAEDLQTPPGAAKMLTPSLHTPNSLRGRLAEEGPAEDQALLRQLVEGRCDHVLGLVPAEWHDVLPCTQLCAERPGVRVCALRCDARVCV